MGIFAWLFRRKKKPVTDVTQRMLTPLCGNYEALPASLAWFDWTDYDSPILSVDGDGTVKLHTWYAWTSGIEWVSLDYYVLTQIAPPGAAWIGMYWMRPSWYEEYIGIPAKLEEAWHVA